MSQNKDRGPVGEMITLQDPSKLLIENQKIFNTWFESWLLNHVPNLMHQQKWFNGNNTIQVEDVVLFTKTESPRRINTVSSQESNKEKTTLYEKFTFDIEIQVKKVFERPSVPFVA